VIDWHAWKHRPWAVALISMGMLTDLQPVQAGLLKPILKMMGPRIETSLTEECLRLTEGSEEIITQLASQACQTMAASATECMLREASDSGRELGVLTELLGGRIGDDAEVVIQRCLASTLGLPKSSLRHLQLLELIND